MTRDSKESTLSRWSRRKLESQQIQDMAEKSTQQAEPEALQVAVSGDEKEAEPGSLLTDADMPDVESLNENSDYSGFMSGGVSDELRNLALRKLFQSPIFNIRDGLDEYDEDYTYFEKLGDIITSDMKHEIEVQEQKLREAMEKELEETVNEDADASATVEDEIDSDEEFETDTDMDLEPTHKQEKADEQ